MTHIERNIILVPTDFTPVADCALDHALEIAALFDHKVCLLHIFGKKMCLNERTLLERKLERIARGNQDRTGIEVSYKLEKGSIFDTIGKVADDIQAEFIVMGIHGKRGVQHITGSYAYKVICNSKIPVMVVKNKHHHAGYNKVVVPVDFTIESPLKIQKAIHFAKYFHSEIYLVGILDSKSSVMKIKKEALLKNLLDYMKTQEVIAHADVLVKPGSDLHDEVLSYSLEIDADLIMIVAEREGRIQEMFNKNDAEQIIDKAEMPVLTVIPNPEYDDDDEGDDSSLLSSFFDPLGVIDRP